MINGIKPLPSVSDFDTALLRLLDNIHKDYQGWSSRIEYSSGVEKVDITIKTGRKFIKIIRDNSVWGFVAKADGTPDLSSGVHYKDTSEEFLNNLSFDDAAELNDWVYDECGDEYTYFLDKESK